MWLGGNGEGLEGNGSRLEGLEGDQFVHAGRQLVGPGREVGRQFDEVGITDDLTWLPASGGVNGASGGPIVLGAKGGIGQMDINLVILGKGGQALPVEGDKELLLPAGV